MDRGECPYCGGVCITEGRVYMNGGLFRTKRAVRSRELYVGKGSTVLSL